MHEYCFFETGERWFFFWVSWHQNCFANKWIETMTPCIFIDVWPFKRLLSIVFITAHKIRTTFLRNLRNLSLYWLPTNHWRDTNERNALKCNYILNLTHLMSTWSRRFSSSLGTLSFLVMLSVEPHAEEDPPVPERFLVAVLERW